MPAPAPAGGRPVPAAGRARLEEFVKQLRIGPHLNELWALLQERGWVFLEMPTGSGKSLGIPGWALLNDVDSLWITLPTVTATKGIHKTLSELVGQRDRGGSWPWIGYGASGSANYDAATRVKAMTTGHAINALVRILRLHTLASRSDAAAAATSEAERAERLEAQMRHWGVPSVIVLDEIHHPTTENFVIFMLLRHAVHTLKMPIKVFVSSATLNSDTLCRGLEDFPTFSVHDTMPHPLTFDYRTDFGKTPENPSYREVLAAVPGIVADIIKSRPEPNVHAMVFLAGEECLQETEAALRKLELPDLEILCIFAGMPTYMMDELFREAAPGTRRVYLCTNVAESSITVDVDVVIDTGYHKVLVPKTTAQILEIERVTKANARQRAGRTGRLREGTVVRLYPEELLKGLPEHAPYEFELIPPYAHVLKLLGAGLDAGVLLGFGPVPAALAGGAGVEAAGAAVNGAGAGAAAGGSGLSAEEQWIQSQFHSGGARPAASSAVAAAAHHQDHGNGFDFDGDGDDGDDEFRPYKRARVDAADSSALLTPRALAAAAVPEADDGPSSGARYQRILDRLLNMQLVASAPPNVAVTELGKRVSAYPVSIPHGAMLVQLADRHKVGTASDATLLAMCIFAAVLETGNPSKLLWLPPEARKDAQAARDYSAAMFSKWFRRDDLEAFVTVVCAMYAEAKRAPGAKGKPGRADHSGWCREHSVNDRVMRAVTGTLRQLVFQSFYCEQWAVDSTIDRVVTKLESHPPDYEALRQTLWTTFPEQVLTDVHAKGEAPSFRVTYALGPVQPGQSRKDETSRWIIDTKRTLNTSYSGADPRSFPVTVLSMCMFKARGATGHLAQLASCVVIAPKAEPAEAGGGGAATGAGAAAVGGGGGGGGGAAAAAAGAAVARPTAAARPAVTAPSRKRPAPTSAPNAAKAAAPAGAGAAAAAVGRKPDASAIAAQRAKNLAYVEEMQAQQKALFERARAATDKAKRMEILDTIAALTKSIAMHLEHAGGKK